MKVGSIHQDQFQTDIDATVVAACVIIHLFLPHSDMDDVFR